MNEATVSAHTELSRQQSGTGAGSEVLVAITAFALVTGQIAMLSVGTVMCEAVLSIAMAVLAWKWLRNPAPPQTLAIRGIIIFYAVFVVLDHMVVHQRPFTVLQFMAGPGAVLFLAGVTIRLEHLDVIVYGLTALLIATTIVFAQGLETLIPKDGKIFLTLAPPDSALGTKHLTGLIGYLLFILPAWANEHGYARRWHHYLGAAFGLYLVAFSTSRGYIEATILFVAAMVLTGLCVEWRSWLRTAALAAFSFVVVALSLALLLVPSFRDAASEVLPASVGVADQRGDIAAGRDVLMLEHFILFERDPVWGIGAFDITTEFRVDELVANSESYLTYTVARDGLGGFFNWLLLAALCWYAIRSGSRFKFAYCFVIIMSMINLGYFGNLYTFDSFVTTAVLFEQSRNRAIISKEYRLAA